MRNLWSCCLSLALIGLPGCGGPGYDHVCLEGQFRINGQPVEQGGILFTPLEADHGRGVYAEVRNGRYEAPDVPVGRIRVTFTAIEYTGRTVTILGQPAPESKILVPKKHRAGMEIEVSPGDQGQDFDLDDGSSPSASRDLT